MNRFVMLMGRLERLNEEVVGSVAGRNGVSPSEIRVLMLLREVGHGAVRPAEIARWVLQTPGGLSATLRRLEDEGRIDKVDDPDDGRGKLISLTGDGQEFHDRVLNEIRERYTLALGDSDLNVAHDVVTQLISAFERVENHPPSGPWFSIPVPHPLVESGTP
ncbi:MAG: MarR family transcriptional regulator [Acidimicrobiales bacterium]